MIDGKKVYAIIAAAGSGKRMNSNISKQIMKIGNMTIIERTISKFVKSKYVDEIIVVIKREEIKKIESIISSIDSDKCISLKYGGDSREQSNYNGIKDLYGDCIAVMHDGARPFIKTKDIDEMLEDFKDKSAMILAVPAKDTIKFVDNMKVESTPDRSRLYMVQTPQIFKLNILKKAYELYFKESLVVTDDSSLVEALGKKVFVKIGNYDNIKVTTSEDIKLAETIAMEEDDENRKWI
ncbi:MAG: 2-C-methyl-D-erythritol 4-phosphate cytidylyltransferase [Tissierellia bacterium]|nr:2-C-methyl-D-erythritol 4-phosphate cytidylyltransferase [Tissierellia bacterium]